KGDAIVRVLVGEGSPVRLGTPALILDVELPEGGNLVTPVPPEFQGFAYMLEGEAAFGANLRRARPPQLVLLGPGEEFTVTDATEGSGAVHGVRRNDRGRGMAGELARRSRGENRQHDDAYREAGPAPDERRLPRDREEPAVDVQEHGRAGDGRDVVRARRRS